MAKSPHAHGPSEVRERVGLVRALERERRRLAVRLVALRNAKEWSREVAAEKIGVHAVHLARMETGRANVTLATLVAVAHAYGVTLVALFGPDTSRASE